MRPLLAALTALALCACTPLPPSLPATITVPAAPRPLTPSSASGVTSQRPTLRWQSAAGTDRVSITLCRDRALTLSCRALEATGSELRLTEALAPGWWFWQLRGSANGVSTVASACWQFRVGPRDAEADASLAPELDFDGDGFDDFAGGRGPYLTAPLEVRFFRGSRAGLVPVARALGLDQGIVEPPNSVRAAGDIDGDGFVDLLVEQGSFTAGTLRASVYPGGPDGVSPHTLGEVHTPSVPQLELLWTPNVMPAGDLDRDGYADLIAATFGADRTPRLQVFLGSARGVAAAPSRTFDVTQWVPGAVYAIAAPAGDMDADGYADVLVRVSIGVPAPYQHRLLWLRGGPDGVLTPGGPMFDLPGQGIGWLLPLGDIDHDGYGDVLAQSSVILRGSPTGPSATSTLRLELADPAAEEAGHYFATYGWALNVGDTDGDGASDLLVRSQSDRYALTNLSWWSALFLAGPLGYGPAQQLQFEPLDSWGYPPAMGLVQSGDFDSDGYGDFIDVVLRGGNPYRAVLQVYRGGPGGPTGPSYSVPWGPDA